MIKLFEHKISVEEILALSVLLLVLGALRIGSVLLFQRERRMLETLHGARDAEGSAETHRSSNE